MQISSTQVLIGERVEVLNATIICIILIATSIIAASNLVIAIIMALIIELLLLRVCIMVLLSHEVLHLDVILVVAEVRRWLDFGKLNWGQLMSYWFS
jgi:hypothetical protein